MSSARVFTTLLAGIADGVALRSPAGKGVAAALASLGIVAAPAAAQTPAGSIIVNIAQANGASSNSAAIRVEELLDIGLTTTARSSAAPVNGVSATPFALANQGNGDEAFVLGGAVSGTTATVTGFAIDTNGNGMFDAGVDTLIAIGGATPILRAGATLALLALIQGEGAVEDVLTITARAGTASGQPGTMVAGGGDGGCDAIVGLTNAMATLMLPLTPPTLDPVPDAVVLKSQSVLSPGGGADPVPGAIITYTLDASFSGAGVARAAQLDDPLPAGTAFVPGSLRLDGEALTDSSDGDAGIFDGATVRVALGDVAAPALRSFSFQVVIK